MFPVSAKLAPGSFIFGRVGLIILGVDLGHGARAFRDELGVG